MRPASRPKPRRSAVRWMDYARRSMQRLGHLKLVTALSESTGTTTLEGIASRFQTAVTATFEVPQSIIPHMLDYIEAHRRAYRDRSVVAPRPLKVEIQDLYLSDPALPSGSGAITGDPERKGYRHAVYVEMPPWAVSLGLLRRGNYGTTDRGKALLALVPETLDHFRTPSVEANPFLLDRAQRLFFLYALVEVDGDLLRCTYERLLAKAGSFTRSEVGDQIADVLAELRRERLKRASSGHELAMSKRMQEVESSVRKQSGSGMGPRESVATPRTEPLVDCGILSRISRDLYAYEFTEGGRRFLERLVQSESVTDFLEKGLASAAGDMVGLAPREMALREILSRVAASYQKVRRGLGYVSLREVAALSVADALRDGVLGFELDDAETAVLEAAGKHGRRIRFARARSASSVQFRIDQKLVDELVCTDP